VNVKLLPQDFLKILMLKSEIREHTELLHEELREQLIYEHPIVIELPIQSIEPVLEDLGTWQEHEDLLYEILGQFAISGGCLHLCHLSVLHICQV
jgi:hypothetical protein